MYRNVHHLAKTNQRSSVGKGMTCQMNIVKVGLMTTISVWSC